MKEYKVAFLSVIATIATYILLALLFGNPDNFADDSLYLFVILFFPLFILSYVAEKLLIWMFARIKLSGRAQRVTVALAITLIVSMIYILIAGLMFGSIREIVIESLGLIVIIIILITYTMSFSPISK